MLSGPQHNPRHVSPHAAAGCPMHPVVSPRRALWKKPPKPRDKAVAVGCRSQRVLGTIQEKETLRRPVTSWNVTTFYTEVWTRVTTSSTDGLQSPVFSNSLKDQHQQTPTPELFRMSYGPQEPHPYDKRWLPLCPWQRAKADHVLFVQSKG